jgi:hypothetical protein
MNVFNAPMFTSPSTLNTSFNSNPVRLKDIFLYSICATVTGTPTGTIKLQASNDPDTNPSMPNWQPPTNFVDIDDSSFMLTTAGKTFWNVTNVAYTWVRIAYVDASSGASTATMTAVINGKG